ncbi:MAG: divergent polysaccharide deacetylase family protein, partial [Alphaproteobacteria bacterium]|nr:divergent polysaccharide deacetylase family protein [Alphaproteobacteria bacterium]
AALQPPPAQTAPAAPPAGEAPPLQAPQTAGRALVADPALIERTPEGPLPKIGDDGTMPMRAYAAPVVSDGKPRIAIVVNGLGISAKATAAALAGLPAGVTLGFAPYASDVQQWVTQARRQGHEVLLEVPMEPYDFPDSDPGQYTLRAGIGEDSNTRRLVWALTRMTGYVGVTNLLGGRLLSDAGALEPVLTYLTRRGLLFYDNGSALHSVAPDVASRVGTYFAQAATTVDTIQSAMEIDHQLSDLEAEARAKGSASGSGFLYPVTVDRVNVWAKGLAGRGFALVPVSAIVTQTKQ